MSWFSAMLGNDARRNRLNSALGDVDQQIAQEKSGTGWQNAFNQSAGAFMQNAMPAFRNQMQLTREDAIRRGVSTGDLGTSYEGDLSSAFQRNIANAMSGQALGAFEGSQNRLMDLLGGKMSQAQSDINSNRNFWAGLLGGGMQAGGNIAAAAMMPGF